MAAAPTHVGDVTFRSIRDVLVLTNVNAAAAPEQKSGSHAANQPASSHPAAANDAATVLAAAVQQRDETIAQLQQRMADERRQLEQEVEELRGTLRVQSRASRDELSVLATRIETLRFATAHQGLTRDRMDAFNSTHVADAATSAAGSAQRVFEAAASHATATMTAGCDRALDHLRHVTVAAREAVTRRQSSEEKAEVQRLMIADHERRVALAKERVRAKVGAAMRAEIERLFTTGIVDLLSEHTRTVMLPATVQGLHPFVRDVVADRAAKRIDAELAAVRADAHALKEQQISVLQQMAAARQAHRALVECREQEADFRDLFRKLDSADAELRRTNDDVNNAAMVDAEGLASQVTKLRKESASMKAELRGLRTGQPAKAPRPRPAPPSPVPLRSDVPAMVASAEKRLEAAVGSSIKPVKAAAAPAARRSVSRSPSASPPRPISAPIHLPGPGGAVAEIPLEDLKRYGLLHAIAAGSSVCTRLPHAIPSERARAGASPAPTPRRAGRQRGDDFSRDEAATLSELRRLRGASSRRTFAK
jgi:hypothetical protein